jgi:hypothetical protein
VEDLEERKKQVVWCGAQFVLGGGPTTNGSTRMNINIAFFDRDQDSFRPSFLLYFILDLILWGYFVQYSPSYHIAKKKNAQSSPTTPRPAFRPAADQPPRRNLGKDSPDM